MGLRCRVAVVGGRERVHPVRTRFVFELERECHVRGVCSRQIQSLHIEFYLLRLPAWFCIGRKRSDGVHGVRERRRGAREGHVGLHDVCRGHVHVLQLCHLHQRV